MAEFQVVVMAGGNGSRLYPLTDDIPKPLLPIANLPMISYIMRSLANVKFDEVIVVAQEAASKAIEQHINEIMRMKVKVISVAIPDQSDDGTAESLRLIKDLIRTDFIVVSCDLVMDAPLHTLADLHRVNDAAVTCLLAESTPLTDVERAAKAKAGDRALDDYIGIEEETNRLIFFASQADYLGDDTMPIKQSVLARHPKVDMYTELQDAHCYIFARWVLDYLVEKKGISSIKGELLPILVRKQFVKSRPGRLDPKQFAPAQRTVQSDPEIWEFIYDDWANANKTRSEDVLRCYAHVLPASSPHLCARANTVPKYMALNRQFPHLMGILPEALPFSIHPNAQISQKTRVGDDSMVGDGVTIGDRCSIKKSIIGKHCVISDKVKISNSVVMGHVTIQEGCIIQNSVVCKHAKIQEGCNLNQCQVGTNFTVAANTTSKNEALLSLGGDDYL